MKETNMTDDEAKTMHAEFVYDCIAGFMKWDGSSLDSLNQITREAAKKALEVWDDKYGSSNKKFI